MHARSNTVVLFHAEYINCWLTVAVEIRWVFINFIFNYILIFKDYSYILFISLKNQTKKTIDFSCCFMYYIYMQIDFLIIQ